MKLSSDMLQNGNRSSSSSSLQHSPKSTILLLTSCFLLLTILPISLQPSVLSPLLSWSGSSTRHDGLQDREEAAEGAPAPAAAAAAAAGKCDIFKGEWVPNPEAPYYTNETCSLIHQHQNCMKFGRPDTEFMKWRWKPNDCELPLFDPAQFLALLRGKSLAFIGDSVARNHMQSLICLLSRVAHAVDVSLVQDEKFPRYHFPGHNFTVASFWSTYLVRAQEEDPNGDVYAGLYNLYLDEPDASWTSQVAGFDYAVVSAGQWFFRPAMFFERGRPAGCHICGRPNVTSLPVFHGYRMAFRTTLQAFAGLGFRGAVFLRTYSPSHFENGAWNKGGDCVRTRPLRSGETPRLVEGIDLEMRRVQVEEFEGAAAAAPPANGTVTFRLLDTTAAMVMRPDGHPSRYGHPAEAKVQQYNDCVHWCLPGAIDAWNDLLLHMLKEDKREGGQIPLPV